MAPGFFRKLWDKVRGVGAKIINFAKPVIEVAKKALPYVAKYAVPVMSGIGSIIPGIGTAAGAAAGAAISGAAAAGNKFLNG
jgi:hypothetical protein